MIRVTIELHRPGSRPQELGHLEITNQSPGDGAEADYSIKSVVRNPSGDIRILQRPLFGFARKHWNVLGLLAQCLEALGPDAMRGREDNELDP